MVDQFVAESAAVAVAFAEVGGELVEGTPKNHQRPSVPRFPHRRAGRDHRGPAQPAARLSTVGNGEAQANDLGFCTEPPDGIDPST
ncbi:hypothetical protein [Micromonospora sp. NPDC049301]|uniref:hypothetical protein n=1 Tax=Micromonospora sp. NPDC049301 TaxID=3155723 RepID=UPI00342B843B